MKIANLMIFSIALVGIGHAIGPPEKVTVFAVSKVIGKTKKTEGKVYHLVAIKLDPAVHLLNTGLGSSVLLVNGVRGKLPLEEGEKERELEDKGHRYRLFWLCLPEKGVIEILWGGVASPKDGPAAIRELLIQAGYIPFRIDAQILPGVRTNTPKDLLAELDKLAEERKRK